MLLSEKGVFYSLSCTYFATDYQVFSWEMFSYFCTWRSSKIYALSWSLPSACQLQSMTLLLLMHSCCWQSMQPGQEKKQRELCNTIQWETKLIHCINWDETSTYPRFCTHGRRWGGCLQYHIFPEAVWILKCLSALYKCRKVPVASFKTMMFLPLGFSSECPD